MAMLIDIIDCLLDRPTVYTLMLMTGDSDFIRVVARARHRFGKRVVIAGVPGSVSSDLIAAADVADPIVEPDWVPAPAPEPQLPALFAPPLLPQFQLMEVSSEKDTLSDIERRLIRLIDYLDRTRPYLTFLFVKTHALSPNNQLNLSPMQVDLVLTQFKERGILRDEVRELEGRTLRLLYFRREHPMVQNTLNGSAQAALI